jgi:hypothetical protein
VLSGERGVDVGGPALAVGHFGRHQPDDFSLHFSRRTRRRLLTALAGATGERQQQRG